MELLDCMLRRRSVRNYNGQLIPDDALQQIVAAGLLSPSSRNLKPVELILVKDPDQLQKLSLSKSAGAAMLKHAYCAIVVIGNSQLSDAWIEDCSISMTYMMLKATELGIANCWVQIRNRFSGEKREAGFISADECLHRLLGLPDTFSVLAVLSLGMADQLPAPHSLSDADNQKVHDEHF